MTRRVLILVSIYGVAMACFMCPMASNGSRGVPKNRMPFRVLCACCSAESVELFRKAVSLRRGCLPSNTPANAKDWHGRDSESEYVPTEKINGLIIRLFKGRHDGSKRSYGVGDDYRL
jgi:hypothetical protein